MEKIFKIFSLAILSSFILLSVGATSAQAMVFTQIPFEWEYYDYTDLTDYDYDDDNNFGSVALGFSVTIGGATYDHFDMDSNGYVQLLLGTQSPTENGYGSIYDHGLYDYNLIDADPSSTYLLAAYDDLTPYY